MNEAIPRRTLTAEMIPPARHSLLFVSIKPTEQHITDSVKPVTTAVTENGENSSLSVVSSASTNPYADKPNEITLKITIAMGMIFFMLRF